MHTIASRWILLIYSHDTWNHEYKTCPMLICEESCVIFTILSQTDKYFCVIMRYTIIVEITTR